MRKTLRTSALALVLSVFGNGIVWAAPHAVASEVAQTAPATWLVTDEDSEIVLFGSVHLLPETAKWDASFIKTKIEEADFVYFEAPMTSAAEAEAQSLIPKYGLATDGRLLNDRIPEADQALLAEISGKYGLAPAQLQQLRPWMVSITLSMLELQTKGFDPAIGVDRVLAEVSSDNIERAFESYEDQFQIFATLSEEAEAAFLRTTMEQLRDTPDAIDGIIDAWSAGDVNRLNTLLNHEVFVANTDLFEAVITKRNVAWVDTLTDVLEGEEDGVVVVGAAHLVGDVGVPALLEQAGYSVQRIAD